MSIADLWELVQAAAIAMALQTTSLHDNAMELPGYFINTPQRTAAPSDHSYALETAKGKKWLLLFVKSRSNDPKSLPIF